MSTSATRTNCWAPPVQRVKGGTFIEKHINAVDAVTARDRIAVIKPSMVAIAMGFNEQVVQRSLAAVTSLTARTLPHECEAAAGQC